MGATTMTARVLLVSFILAFACAPHWALPQRQQAVRKQVTVSTTQAPPTTSPSSLADDLAASGSTAAATTTTTANLDLESTEPAPAEPITMTTDSLSVNLDEASTAVINGELGGEPTTSDGNIETKSIVEPAESAPDNGLYEPNAKLSIDGNGAAETPADGDSSADGEGTAPIRPPKMGKGAINMSQVDQIYVSERKDEQETVEAWQRMNRKLKKGIGAIIGSIVPLALNMSQEARISSNCSGAMLKWVLSMNQLKSWALRMLDATGKPIAGLLEGSMTLFGNYRQCLKIRAPDDDEIEFAGEFREYFRGKYCIVQAKPWLPEKDRFYNLNTKIKALMSNEAEEAGETSIPAYERTIFDELSEWALAFNFVDIRVDLCIPSVCSREDIQRAVSFILRGIDLKARVLRCEMEAPGSAYGAASVESGSTEFGDALAAIDPAAQWSESVNQLAWILVPAVAVALVLLATAISMATGENHQDHDAKKTNKLSRTLRSISLTRSVSSHLNVDYDQLADDKPLALYGIRFLLVLWVLLVESAINLKFEYLRELLMLKDLIFWWPMQIVINSTLQFDSLILLTAFTMGYKNCFNDGAHQAKALTRFVLDKYIRLMPSIMVMVALVVLLPLAYKGPVWNDFVTKQSAVCQSTGWLNTVFLQNYLPYKEICLPQTWLLCVELQLVLLMAPVVYYLNKNYTNPNNSDTRAAGNNSNGLGNIRHGNHHAFGSLVSKDAADAASKPFYSLRTIPGCFLLGCIVFGLLASFYNVYSNDLPPSWFYTMADPDSKAIYFSQHMMRLWTHVAVFAMGILAGVECRRASKNAISRDYRGANLGLLSRIGGGLKQHHKSHSSSSSSLPVISSAQSDSLSSKSPSDINTSSTSIDIQATMNKSHENISGGGLINGKDVGGGSGDNDNNGANNNVGSIGGDRGRGEASGRLCSIVVDVISCLVAITTMTTIIFSTHDWSLYDLPKPLVAGIFDAGSRFLWSLALIWILYMVSVPGRDRKFSLLARSLGHPAMVCLGKLSFLIYIIHPFVHTTVLAIQEQPIYSSWLMLFHILVGNITLTVILASLVSLFVEMPCRNLFRRCGTSLLLTHAIETSSSCGACSCSAGAGLR